ncbi:MAG TPA: hypothetical protein VK746_18260, partial [Candidatus Eisenbacteria bacterium]|nr:hypothetical protein [Candidatus Eisenbacteria bacterium]
GDVLAVRLDYLPSAMMWLVTTPNQARLMRKAREGRTTSDVCVMSLAEAQELFTTVGDPMPSGLYEVAAWLLAPAPEDFSTPAPDESDSVDLEEPEDLS